MSETELLTQVMQALAIEPGVLCWRNNTGQARVHGSHVRFGLGPGSADIIGILWGSGRFVALECKTKVGKMSDEQRKWSERVTTFGGHYAVVRSVAEARAAIKEARGQ